MQSTDNETAVGTTTSLSVVAGGADVASRLPHSIDAGNPWSDRPGAMRATPVRVQCRGAGPRG